MDRGAFDSATAAWAALEGAVGNVTDNVDWYNALLHKVDDEASANSWLQYEGAGNKQVIPLYRLCEQLTA